MFRRSLSRRQQQRRSNPGRQYFCHSCMQVVDVSHDVESGEIACLICQGSFVEELDPRESLSHVVLADDNGEEDDGEDEDFDFEDFLRSVSRQRRRIQGEDEMRNAMVDLFQSARSREPRGARGSPIFPGSIFGTLMGIGTLGNPGDYASNNADYQAILSRLLGADAGGGPTPTARSAFEAMPRKLMTEDDLESGESECVVCQEDFKVRDNYVELPCKHRFHEECIKPWLDSNNTCPTCRYKLPVEGGDGDASSASGSASSDQAGARSSGNNRVHRFSIGILRPRNRRSQLQDSASSSSSSSRRTRSSHSRFGLP